MPLKTSNVLRYATTLGNQVERGFDNHHQTHTPYDTIYLWQTATVLTNSCNPISRFGTVRSRTHCTTKCQNYVF